VRAPHVPRLSTVTISALVIRVMLALPDEILCDIFAHGASSSCTLHLKPFSFAVLVSHVCRTWRDVAIDMSYLWSTIDATLDYRPAHLPHNFERQYEFLKRSRDHPLQIILNGSDLPDSADLFLRRLAECCDRVERLVIFTGDRIFLNYLQARLRSVRAPRLRVLQEDHWCGSTSPYGMEETFVQDAPALEHISQYGEFRLPPGSFGEHLVKVMFTSGSSRAASLASLVRLSDVAPRLAHLTFMGPVDAPPHTEPIDIHFPHLRSLRLMVGRFQIIAPDLECLVLTGNDQSGDLYIFLAAIAARPRNMRFPRVHHLHLDDFAYSQQDLGDLCIRAFEDLRTLHIDRMRPGSILAAIGRPTGDSRSWPRLRCLAVQYTTLERMLGFIRARGDARPERVQISPSLLKARALTVPERNDMVALKRLVQVAPLPMCMMPGEEDYDLDFEIHCPECDWGEDEPLRTAFPAAWGAAIDHEDDSDEPGSLVESESSGEEW
jgi:hypothetical protein